MSRCPVSTTLGPSPRTTFPVAFGRSGNTGCSCTSSKPDVGHHRREELRELALLTEDGRDPADLLDELDRPIEVEGLRYVGSRVGNRRRRERLVHVPHRAAGPLSVNQPDVASGI